jgi:hypothetical protein
LEEIEVIPEYDGINLAGALVLFGIPALAFAMIMFENFRSRVDPAEEKQS